MNAHSNTDELPSSPVTNVPSWNIILNTIDPEGYIRYQMKITSKPGYKDTRYSTSILFLRTSLNSQTFSWEEPKISNNTIIEINDTTI